MSELRRSARRKVQVTQLAYRLSRTSFLIGDERFCFKKTWSSLACNSCGDSRNFQQFICIWRYNLCRIENQFRATF